MPRIFIQCENARRMETFPSSGDSRPDGLFVEPTPEKPNRAGIPAVVTNLGEEPVAGLGLHLTFSLGRRAGRPGPRTPSERALM